MAKSDCTGSVCLPETPHLPIERPAWQYSRLPDAVFSICEPRGSGYHAPVAETARILAKNVRLYRTLRGWSQETLAELAGLNRTFVGAIERCEHNSSLATIEKLAKAFDLTAADLLTPRTLS